MPAAQAVTMNVRMPGRAPVIRTFSKVGKTHDALAAIIMISVTEIKWELFRLSVRSNESGSLRLFAV
jgi:hypothetical protein